MVALTLLKKIKYRSRLGRIDHHRKKLVWFMLLTLCSFVSNVARIHGSFVNVAAFVRVFFIIAYSKVFRYSLLNYVKILNITKSITVVVFFNILFFGCIARIMF